MTKTWKSGGFPIYTEENGQTWVCLFISNDSRYGGEKPQMAKGHPDNGELDMYTAWREIQEETGVSLKNIVEAFPIGKFDFKGQVKDYVQYVWGFQLSEMRPAGETEEGKGVWLKLEDALEQIRPDQRVFLEKI